MRGDLHPVLVQSHFLLAMVSIAFGMVAIRRSAEPESDGGRLQDQTRAIVLALTACTGLVLITGTVVTGTGPHAGEEDVRRFGFDISNVARLHSIAVIVALLVAVALAWRLRSDPSGHAVLGGSLSAWIFIGLLQGGIGYVQYFNGVPELLVGAHIAFATALWVVTIQLADLAVATSGAADDAQVSAGVPSPA